MSDEDANELPDVQKMMDALMNFGEKEIRRVNEMNVPRLILGRDFGTFDPWTKQDLEDTFRAALGGSAAAESRLLNSAATSDGPASRYITWLYALLFWFREHPEHLTEVENVLRLGRERGITTPPPEIAPRESYLAARHHGHRLLSCARGLRLRCGSKRSEADYRETLVRIHQELERTSALIENLMTLARTDSGSEALRVAPTNLNEVLLEISEPARLLAEGKSIHYEQRLAETPLRVSGNAPSLRRLFLILIDNAVKYTPREGRILVVLDASDDAAVTEIRDTGVGISPTDLPHIFERFYRADESRSRESGGTGLGLSIAKWIAEAHQGKISVASKIGEGSVFRVQIPLSKDGL